MQKSDFKIRISDFKIRIWPEIFEDTGNGREVGPKVGISEGGQGKSLVKRDFELGQGGNG